MEVELDIFSGRPNPHWNLTTAQQTELQTALAALPVTGSAVPENDGLGYRGFRVSDPANTGRCIVAYAGYVTVSQGGWNEARKDEARTIERWLLDSGAPYLDSTLRQRVPLP